MISIVEVLSSLQMRAGAEVFVTNLCNAIKKNENVKLSLIILYDDLDESFEYLKNSTDMPVFFCHKKRGFDLKAAKRFKRILKEIKPDVVHMHIACLATYMLAFGLKKQKWQVFETVHNILPRDVSRINDIIRSIYLKRKTLNLIGISDLISESIKANCHLKECITIYNSIPLHIIDPIPFEKRKYTIIHIGVFREQKNHKMLFDVFNELYKKDNSVTLCCLGDGPLFEQYRNYISGLECVNNITLAGAQSDVYKYLLDSKVFVLSSLFEGNPISILEAMNCGLPIVAPKVGGIPDVVENERNGYLFTVSNNEEMLEALRLALLPDNLERISAQNIEDIQQYSIENCAKIHCETFIKYIEKSDNQ